MKMNLTKNIPSILSKIGISALLAIATSPEAIAAQASPNTFAVSVGTFTGVASSLAEANEKKFVTLYTNRKGNLTATFQYSASGLASGLSLAGVLRQYLGSDVFSFHVKNASGTWVKVGSFTGGTSTKSISMPLPSGAVVGGSISLRLTSSSGAQDIELDQLVLRDDGGISLTPTPSPTPSPTPVSSPSPTPVASPTPASPVAVTVPARSTWYMQLQGTVNQNVAAKVYDIDLYDTPASTFTALKQAGHTVICYFSAGSYEDWRSDANQFPTAALGNNLDGWPGEKWLDVRNSTVRQIMAKRMDLAKSKGCDGVDPDNVDGYQNRSGFPLTAQDQINYNTFLADQAHARGMVVGLKNSTDLVAALVSKFDFAVVEECFAYNECGSYSPFIQQNKAVFNAEYSNYSSSICTQAKSLGFSTTFYNLALDGRVHNPCP